MIRAEDRISEVLARDEELVEVLTTFSPHFDKLRNPALRRVLGRLVTVRDAAGLAGVELDALLSALNGETGADPKGVTVRQMAITDSSHPRPFWFDSIPQERIVELDVRDELRAGREPFGLIMDAVREVTEGKVLRLRATFEPVPLYHVLEKRGLQHWTECVGEGDWIVWFFSPGAADMRAVEADDATSSDALHGAPVVFDQVTTATRSSPDEGAGPTAVADNNATSVPPAPDPPVVIRLDVRGLEPPEPMMRTLEALDAMPAGGTLIQTNVRIPRFLIEELNRRGYPSESRQIASGVVELTIRKP